MKIVKNENYLSQACDQIQDSEWASIKMRLFLGMKSRNDAVGLACNQIGIKKRGFVINYNNKLIFFKNPMITYWDVGGRINHKEKCLSLPKKELLYTFHREEQRTRNPQSSRFHK